jgi:hypothetical protein
MVKEETARGVSRRDFLQGTAAATGAVALMGSEKDGTFVQHLPGKGRAK